MGWCGWGCDAAGLGQARFRNADYDAANEAFVRTPPGPERNALARRMSEIVAAYAPNPLRTYAISNAIVQYVDIDLSRKRAARK